MKHSFFSDARKVTRLTVFLSVVAGLALGNGWGTPSSMGIDAVAYLCPLGALETMVASGSISLRALALLIVACVIIVVTGRAFCSWICPMPSIQRFFHPKVKPSKKASSTEDSLNSETVGLLEGKSDSGIRPSQSRPKPLTREETQVLAAACDGKRRLAACGSKRDGLQVDSRHGVLVGALVSSAVCGFPVFCLICPVGLTFALVIGVYRAVFEQSSAWSLIAFAGILVIEVIFFRKWCHRFCPIGALMSLVGLKASIGRPHVNEEVCLRSRGIDCRECVDSCPESLDPHGRIIPECTKCGVCAEGRPAHAIELRLFPKRADADRVSHLSRLDS